MSQLLAPLLRATVWINTHLTTLSVILTRLTAKSTQAIHPKHLVDDPHHYWYVKYIQSNDLVLDVGCGIGAAVLKVASYANFVVGFDYSLRNLSVARSLQDGGGMNKVAFVVANAEAPLPFAKASFDRVLFLDVCEHLNRRVEVLREIERVLRPDGLMLLSVPNRENSWKRCLRAAGLPYYSDADHKIEYTLAELKAELLRGGFHVVGDPQPTVLETPLMGMIDFVGGISLGLYAKLQRWKIEAARRNPKEATGWRVVCAKANARTACVRIDKNSSST